MTATAAILVNLPGEASSAITCLDGHAMARSGRAGAALAVAAVASFVGGTIGTLVMAALATPEHLDEHGVTPTSTGRPQPVDIAVLMEGAPGHINVDDVRAVAFTNSPPAATASISGPSSGDGLRIRSSPQGR